VRKPTPEPDDRPPICPACGVTMGIIAGKGGGIRFVCLECGFSDNHPD
jgi:tRNA(Ile2) C34 agmatinyltransferase TiaS